MDGKERNVGNMGQKLKNLGLKTLTFEGCLCSVVSHSIRPKGPQVQLCDNYLVMIGLLENLFSNMHN